MCYTLFADHTCGCPPCPIQPYYKLCAKFTEKAEYVMQGKDQEHVTATFPPQEIEKCSKPLHLDLPTPCDLCRENLALEAKSLKKVIRRRGFVLKSQQEKASRHLQQEVEMKAGECIHPQPSPVPDDYKRLRSCLRVADLKRSFEAAFQDQHTEAGSVEGSSVSQVGITVAQKKVRSTKRSKRPPRSVPEDYPFRTKHEEEEELV